MPTVYPIDLPPMNEELLIQYRCEAQAKEEQSLSPDAAFSADHERRYGNEDDHRLPYKRDVDRIVHSKAYARYSDKTQVVYLMQNDHVTYRGLHVQLVSTFARGIAEILRLNHDLVEAIALGHDVGHPPFGHEGEEYLSALSQEFGEGRFAHPRQSCRLFSEIEPLNLGLAVYDGFLCHDGGMRTLALSPRLGKTWDDHAVDLALKQSDPDALIIPGTLEGCLVKVCDTISYLGRDLEDAISLGIIERCEVPQTFLGQSNREILQHLACDIIRNSYGKGVIAFSQEAHEALQQIRTFNFERIYTHPQLKLESTKIKRCYRMLFEMLLNEHQEKGKESFLWKDFIHNKTERYRSETSPVRMVIDYISGMTDRFFMNTLERFFFPKQIEL